ncbi:MAG: hypothetical protein GY745_21275 [Actinomycetia bacterium]|nr:hypothetical protein [Actinomycetes bacterium]
MTIAFLVVVLVGVVAYVTSRTGDDSANTPTDVGTSNQSPAEYDTSAPTNFEPTLLEEPEYTILLEQGWQRSASGQTTSTTRYEKGDAYLEITLNPAGSGVNSDLSWRYLATEDGRSVKLIGDVRNLCEPNNSGFCSAGDGALDIFAKQSDSDSTSMVNDAFLSFRAGVSNSEDPNVDVVDEIRSMIESVTLT